MITGHGDDHGGVGNGSVDVDGLFAADPIVALSAGIGARIRAGGDAHFEGLLFAFFDRNRFWSRHAAQVELHAFAGSMSVSDQQRHNQLLAWCGAWQADNLGFDEMTGTIIATSAR